MFVLVDVRYIRVGVCLTWLVPDDMSLLRRAEICVIFLLILCVNISYCWRCRQSECFFFFFSMRTTSKYGEHAQFTFKMRFIRIHEIKFQAIKCKYESIVHGTVQVCDPQVMNFSYLLEERPGQTISHDILHQPTPQSPSRDGPGEPRIH